MNSSDQIILNDKKNMWKLIDDCRTRMADGKYNHVSLFNPSCRLFIDSKYEKFMNLYNKLYGKVAYGIAEMPGPYSHVIIDIDVKVPHGRANAGAPITDGAPGASVTFLDDRLYGAGDVARVVQIYQRQLKTVLYDPRDNSCVSQTRDYLNLNESGDCTHLDSAPAPDLTAFVLEKKHDYVYKGYRKSGFHIHFPNIVLSAHNIKSFVHSQVCKEVQAVIPNSTDDCMSNKPILLYGSRKSPEMECYELTRVFDESGNEVAPNAYFKQDILGVDLPRFFRVNVANKSTSVIRPYLCSKVTCTTEVAPKSDDYSYDFDFEENIEEVTTLLNMLSDDRATEHDKWMEIGWVLFSISGGSSAGFRLWIEFSKRTKDPTKFDDSVCAFEWQRMWRGRYTIRTLAHYASIDSPERYADYKKRNIKNNYIQYLRDTDTDFAEMLHIMFGDRYKCANIDKDMWYFFHNHRWHRMDGAHDLRRKIDTDLKSLYINQLGECKKRRHFINQQIAKASQAGAAIDADEEDTDDEEARDADNDIYADLRGRDSEELTAELEPLDGQSNKINEIIKSLGMSGRKNAIIKECRFMFYDKMFCDMLDENPNLLCFNNGVYDFDKHQFREGRPTDCISKTTGYDYVELARASEVDVREIEDFMHKLYPDPILCEYMWQNDASNLVGGNYEKIFVAGSGPRGNNGKSKKQNLIESAFGDYCIHLPTSLLVGKRTASSSCTPELSRAPGARIAFVQEPDNNDVFQCGIIKELTGNDKMYVRALFMEGREVQLMFKLHMTCNYLPRVYTTDPAFWNRMVVVPYDSVFVPPELCPIDPNEQYIQKIFPEDKNISNRLHELKHVYMAMLIEKHRALIEGRCAKIYPSAVPAINKTTLMYKESADVIQKFVTANYIKDNSNASLPLEDMFRAYKLFLTDMGYSNKTDINEFSFQLNSKFTIINNVVYGVRQKTINLAPGGGSTGGGSTAAQSAPSPQTPSAYGSASKAPQVKPAAA